MLKILIRYESKLVLRNRLFVGAAGTLLSVAAVVQSIRIAAVVREDFDFSWKTGRFLWLAASLLPTGIPLETVIISTITMSIVSVFLVATTIGRDDLFDTEAAALARSVTNAELVA